MEEILNKIAIALLMVLASIIVFCACSDDSTSPIDADKQIGWVVGSPLDDYGTIFFTDDGGKTWQRQGDVSSIPNSNFSAIKAYSKDHAFVIGSQADGYATIMKTEDGGKNWTRLGNANNIPDIEISGFFVESLSELWIVGFDNTLLYTKDGGNTWTHTQIDLPHPYQFASIAKVGNKIWICGNHQQFGGVIVHSTDGGNTWAIQGDEEFMQNHGMIDISSVSDKVLWMVGHGRSVLRTSDGGENWIIQKKDNSPDWDANGVTAIDENICWVVEDAGYIYKTTDAGNTWLDQNLPQNSANYFLYRISAINKDIAWVVGPSMYPPFSSIILFTDDGGKTWTQQDFSAEVFMWDISFVGAKH